MKRRPFLVLGVTASLAVLAACQEDAAAPEPPGTPRFSTAAGESAAEQIAGMMDAANAALAAAGADYRAAIAEYITIADSHEAGATIIAKDVGNKQLTADFIPFDPRRPWSGANGGVTYAIDQTGDAVPFFGGLTAGQTTGAIQRAMATWDGVNCSDLSIGRANDFGLDVGLIAFQLSGGLIGSPFVFADVQHAGWRDLNFVRGTLATTFTFVFINPDDSETDVDGNGKADVAFREIYYDPNFIWSIDANVDVETIALHEAGHGLSQAHFGNIMIKNNGTVKASPRAVMNALYTGPLQRLRGTDNGGHCSNWANWPQG